MHPDNEEYQNKVAFYKEKIEERDLLKKTDPTNPPNPNIKDEFKSKPTPTLLPIDDGNLTDKHKKELTLFGLKAMGFKGGIEGVKEILSIDEIKELIASGLNLNGLLCAEIVEINPLKLNGKFEIVCVAYRGGTSTKSYIIEAFKGTAFEQ